MIETSQTLDFRLSQEHIATEPLEASGRPRDMVRLLVARRDSVIHTRFRHLSHYLQPDDLLVVNDSATMPAAIDGMRLGYPLVVHISRPMERGTWSVELRPPDQSGPFRRAQPGDQIELAGGGSLTLIESDEARRLWVALMAPGWSLPRLLRSHGRPIRYPYVSKQWPLDAYQTLFARQSRLALTQEVGWSGSDVFAEAFTSAEMPSAARPFTPELVAGLGQQDVRLAAITLHSGVSSLESHEPPQPERFRVPPETAELVRRARRVGGRIIAVGTTVARTLETVATGDGNVRPGAGITDLVLGPETRTSVVDGLISGWHPPEASHLHVLQAVAGKALVARAYEAAVKTGYKWHEFGDSCLLLPAA